MGTPKTMKEAIQNGINSYAQKSGMDLTDHVYLHVMDFIRNKLSVFMLRSNDDEVSLLKRILGVISEIKDEHLKAS